MSTEFEKYAIKHVGIGSNTLHEYNKVMSDRLEDSLTPYILEEREMRATQMDIFSRLLRDRILWLSGAIHDGMSPVVQAQLMFLDNTETKDITMHLDTPGGGVGAGLSIIDVMNYIKSDVATVNTGMCASMGSVLLSAGAKGKRASLVYSKVMTHMVSHGNQGNIQATRINQLEAEKINYILFKILATNCGKKFDEIYELSRNDKWFTSDDALKFGLIDNIINGDKKNSITKMLEGFDAFYNKEVLSK